MILSTFLKQAIIVIAVIIIFFLSVILNRKTKAPKDVKLPEKCQFCPSNTCVIKLGEVEKKKEELKEYLENCEEKDGSEEKN
ncbi:MAG: hypothetical protein PHX62_07835 [Bacilli bacterium]|nr:hypothetical protein [Bacilli bacterium]